MIYIILIVFQSVTGSTATHEMHTFQNRAKALKYYFNQKELDENTRISVTLDSISIAPVDLIDKTTSEQKQGFVLKQNGSL